MIPAEYPGDAEKSGRPAACPLQVLLSEGMIAMRQ